MMLGSMGVRLISAVVDVCRLALTPPTHCIPHTHLTFATPPATCTSRSALPRLSPRILSVSWCMPVTEGQTPRGA